jgi:uncharacterized protein (TIGR00730 family)
MASKVVAVFGGSNVMPGSPEYVEAYEVGKMLASASYIILNGGYAGTMEASARGAKENGGRVIGVISGEFHGLTPNAYLDETIVQRDLFDRIRDMQTRADAFIVLKGSMGTLAELALVWILSKLDAKQRKPIVLVGDSWARVLNSWREHLAVTDEEAHLLGIAKDPCDALDHIHRALDGQSDMHPFPISPSS